MSALTSRLLVGTVCLVASPLACGTAYVNDAPSVYEYCWAERDGECRCLDEEVPYAGKPQVKVCTAQSIAGTCCETKDGCTCIATGCSDDGHHCVCGSLPGVEELDLPGFNTDACPKDVYQGGDTSVCCQWPSGECECTLGSFSGCQSPGQQVASCSRAQVDCSLLGEPGKDVAVCSAGKAKKPEPVP